MGLLNLFRRNGKNEVQVLNVDTETVPPKEIFIEERDPDHLKENKILIGLESIYKYAETDFEEKGFNDALSNPDFSYNNDNIRLLKYDLEILVQKALTLYENTLHDVNFHIESRKRAGLIDTVYQLETLKAKIESNITKVMRIHQEYIDNTGLVERIELSYKRGFLRGLAALSDKIINIQAD